MLPMFASGQFEASLVSIHTFMCPPTINLAVSLLTAHENVSVGQLAHIKDNTVPLIIANDLVMTPQNATYIWVTLATDMNMSRAVSAFGQDASFDMLWTSCQLITLEFLAIFDDMH